MIISKIWIFKLPDIDQGIQKHVIQKKEEFSAFLKKVMKRKWKKSNNSITRTTLYTQKIKFCVQNFFSKNVCLNTKISLRLKKKFLEAISKILVIQFPYMEIVWLKFFFQKTKIKIENNGVLKEVWKLIWSAWKTVLKNWKTAPTPPKNPRPARTTYCTAWH